MTQLTDHLPQCCSEDLAAEIATQPDNWLTAADLAQQYAELLPAPGEKVAVLGCGTSFYIAQSYAALREDAGLGMTDAWPASDARLDRGYDRFIALSRSGTTSEVLHILSQLPPNLPVTVITADLSTPIVSLGQVIDLSAFDERAVVQTRFATSALAMLRTHLGHDLTSAVHQAREVLAAEEASKAPGGPLAMARAADQITFVGMGWTVGLANEASLKLKESTQSWTESYPMTEYRHGPISIAAPGRVVWALGELVPGFADDVAVTGAHLISTSRDPMAELVMVHQLCLLRAADRNMNAAQPRNLARSVILTN